MNKYRVILILIFIVILVPCLLYLFNNHNDNLGDIISYEVTIIRNGADKIKDDKLTCIKDNNGCYVTLPNVNRSNGVVLGFSLNKDDKYATYFVNDKLYLDKNMVLYVISYQDNKLDIDSSNLDYISNKELMCRMYNSDESCDVTLPYFNKNGYETRGYSTNEKSLTGIFFPGDIYELKKDSVLYPIYNDLARNMVLNINNNYYFENTVFDIETGCNNDIANEYIEYFSNIRDKAPYLLIGNKITFMNDSSFDKIWGSSYAGMNYGPKGMRLFDVRCSKKVPNNYYATIVHELAHTWDFYYGNKLEKEISSQNDIINLYTKYSKLNNRPFRDYSYSNINEFFADMVRYYYFKYIDSDFNYLLLDYPEDIKNVLEKYICIANNNYNEKGCIS